jgi:PhnB protein
MIPDGYRSLTPYRTVADGAGPVAFYEKALGAKLRLKMERPDGKLDHTELEIGDSVVMLADERPGHEAYAPTHFGGSPVSTTMSTFLDEKRQGDRAVAAGAKLKRRVRNMFYSDRAGFFINPFGRVWHVAAHIEEVPPNRHTAAAMSQGTGP